MRTAHRIRRAVAAFVTAGVVAVVGVTAISPETAQAAGIVVQHRTYGAPETGTPPRDEE